MNQGPCTNRLPALPVSSQSRGEDDRPSVSRNSPPIPNSASWFWTATDGPRADRCEVTRRLPGTYPIRWVNFRATTQSERAELGYGQRSARYFFPAVPSALRTGSGYLARGLALIRGVQLS